MRKDLNLNALHTISVIVLLAGAIGSVGLTLYTGRNNASVILMMLFVVWVLSPFMAQLIASMISKRWPTRTRKMLYSIILILSPLALIVYSGILSPPGTKTAFVFLIFPLVSWLLMAIIIPLALSMARKREAGG